MEHFIGFALRDRVQRCRGFIEEKKLRALVQRPRHEKLLLLSAGERTSSLFQTGHSIVHAKGQTADGFPQPHLLQALLHPLPVHVFIRHGHILGHGKWQDRRLLKNRSDQRVQVLLFKISDVLAV